MDATKLAASLLEPIPANASFGLFVVRAVAGTAEVGLIVTAQHTNVIGSLHSSGSVALVDAAGLAALISVADEESQLDDVVPLGREAHLEFLAPAYGRLIARCQLTEQESGSLVDLFTGRTTHTKVSTTADVIDADELTVCRGSFSWSLKRRTAHR